MTVKELKDALDVVPMTDLRCTCVHPLLSSHDDRGCAAPLCDCALGLPWPGPGVYRNMPAEAYHRLPYLSASFLKSFRECPATALLPRTASEVMLLGQALHCYVLEGVEAFWSRFAIMVESDLNKTSNDYKRLKASWLESVGDKTVLPFKPKGIDLPTVECLAGMNASLRSHPTARMFLENHGLEELTVIGRDPESGQMCKARMDRQSGRQVIAELKLCSNIGAFDRQIRDMNYHVQVGHYVNVAVWSGLFPEFGLNSSLSEQAMTTFLAVDPAPPHQVRTISLSPDYLDWARHEARRLVRLVAECRERNDFPAYSLSGMNSLDDVSPSQLLEEVEKPTWVN